MLPRATRSGCRAYLRCQHDHADNAPHNGDCHDQSVTPPNLVPLNRRRGLVAGGLTGLGIAGLVAAAQLGTVPAPAAEGPSSQASPRASSLSPQPAQLSPTATSTATPGKPHVHPTRGHSHPRHRPPRVPRRLAHCRARSPALRRHGRGPHRHSHPRPRRRRRAGPTHRELGLRHRSSRRDHGPGPPPPAGPPAPSSAPPTPPPSPRRAHQRHLRPRPATPTSWDLAATSSSSSAPTSKATAAPLDPGQTDAWWHIGPDMYSCIVKSPPSATLPLFPRRRPRTCHHRNRHHRRMAGHHVDLPPAGCIDEPGTAPQGHPHPKVWWNATHQIYADAELPSDRTTTLLATIRATA